MLLLPLWERAGAIEITFEQRHMKSWIEISQFKDMSSTIDKLRLYQYYIAFIDLCAELSWDRNLMAY